MKHIEDRQPLNLSGASSYWLSLANQAMKHTVKENFIWWLEPGKRARPLSSRLPYKRHKMARSKGKVPAQLAAPFASHSASNADTNQRRYTLAGAENAARDTEAIYMDFCQRQADLLRRIDSQIQSWTKLREGVQAISE